MVGQRARCSCEAESSRAQLYTEKHSEKLAPTRARPLLNTVYEKQTQRMCPPPLSRGQSCPSVGGTDSRAAGGHTEGQRLVRNAFLTAVISPISYDCQARRPVTHVRVQHTWSERVFGSHHTVLPFSDRLTLQADLRAIWLWHSVRGAPCANGLGLDFKISHPEEGTQPERGEQVSPHQPPSLLTHS